ncbi:MAG TPA: thymidine kinase [Cytophagales bacterium]|nr:thymidine kinase [Cytophagales bacterium]
MHSEYHNLNSGYIEVICGPMFCGKTEELIRRVKRAMISRQNVIIFKPKIDDRYHPDNVVSHSEVSVKAIAIGDIEEIYDHIKLHTVIAIDEAQFFSEKIVDITSELANKGKRVIVAGLDKDSFGKPFGTMPSLMAIADFVTKLHSICVVCGRLASFTFRKTHNKDVIMVGTHDVYEARCRKCYSDGQYNIF